MAKKQKQPSAKLRQLNKLVGRWTISGPEVSGEVTFEWFAGNFFLVQRGWVDMGGGKMIFVEYIGYDAKRRVCASHMFGNGGENLTYDWKVGKDTIRIWYGKKGSKNSFTGRFAKDGRSWTGAWKWPGGGFEATLTKRK